MGKSQAPAGTTWSNVPGLSALYKTWSLLLVNAPATHTCSVKYGVRLSRFSPVIKRCRYVSLKLAFKSMKHFFEKLIFAQLAKKFLAFCGN
jgi:hypothetical protein